MKKLFFILVSVLAISCSDQLECEIQNLELHNLKGNIKEVYSVTFDVINEYSDIDYIHIPYKEAEEASYYQYDENGLCTSIIEYSIPWENCKKNSYLVYCENGRLLEFVKWNVDNDKYDDKICHYEYSYTNDGRLIDTYDRLYDWLLNKKSKSMSSDEMKKDLSGYIFVKTINDTIAALKFSKDKGLTDFVHYAVVEGKKYEFAYSVNCNVKRKCHLDKGKVKKNEYENGTTETFYYSENIMTEVHVTNKEGTSDYEYINGYPQKGKKYDTGKNLVTTIDYSHSGNIRGKGILKWVVTDQSGKKKKYENYFENGKSVKQVVENDSTTITDLKYNENGDLVSINSKNYVETRKYQYDEKGNWVICYIFDKEEKLISVIQRVIVYGD